MKILDYFVFVLLFVMVALYGFLVIYMSFKSPSPDDKTDSWTKTKSGLWKPKE